MNGMAARRLHDLLATAEPISDDQGVGGRAAHRREEYPLAAGDRDLIGLALLVSERAGHSATARVQYRVFRTGGLEKSGLAVEAEHRLFMAMSVNHDLARERWNREGHGLLHEEFAERESLIAKSPRLLVVRQHVHELVAKHGHATRLEPHDTRTSADVRSERRETVSYTHLRAHETPEHLV